MIEAETVLLSNKKSETLSETIKRQNEWMVCKNDESDDYSQDFDDEVPELENTIEDAKQHSARNCSKEKRIKNGVNSGLHSAKGSLVRNFKKSKIDKAPPPSIASEREKKSSSELTDNKNGSGVRTLLSSTAKNSKIKTNKTNNNKNAIIDRSKKLLDFSTCFSSEAGSSNGNSNSKIVFNKKRFKTNSCKNFMGQKQIRNQTSRNSKSLTSSINNLALFDRNIHNSRFQLTDSNQHVNFTDSQSTSDNVQDSESKTMKGTDSTPDESQEFAIIQLYKSDHNSKDSDSSKNTTIMLRDNKESEEISKEKLKKGNAKKSQRLKNHSEIIQTTKSMEGSVRMMKNIKTSPKLNRSLEDSSSSTEKKGVVKPYIEDDDDDVLTG